MLTALKVKNAKPGKHTDHRGLFPLVRPSGGKFWILRVQRHGHRRDFRPGSALDVGLEDARHAAQTLRQQIKRGERQAKPALAVPHQTPRKKVPTFETAARDCYDALKDGWQDKRKKNWIAGFEANIFLLIGTKAIDKVDVATVRDALAPIWLKIPDTARKILQRTQAVLYFAHLKGWIPGEVNLRMVRKDLPKQTDRSNHYAAIPYAEAPAPDRRLAIESATAGRDALRFHYADGSAIG